MFLNARLSITDFFATLRAATLCIGIRDVDVLWRWPGILGTPVDDRCLPAAAVTWQALIGGPVQLVGASAWLPCHGRQSATLAEGARELTM